MSAPLRLPTLDVVIPCYNEENEIADCLEALLAQKHELTRIIIVDNNSTDTTAKLLAKYAKKHSEIYLLKETQQGIEYARDTGINASRADIVARIDADTRVLEGWARAIREFYANNPTIAAGSGATEFYDLPFRRFTNIMAWFFTTSSNRLVAHSSNLYGANMTIRVAAWKDIVDTLPTRNQRIMEDLSISLALQKKDYHVAHISKAKAHVSGRRIRSHPRDFYHYNKRWPATYRAMGFTRQARRIAVVAWFGCIAQAIASLGFLFYDPHTTKFSMRRYKHGYETRPWL